MARCRSYLRGLAICVTVLLLTFLINRFFIRFNLIGVSGVVMIGVGFSSIDGNTPVAELFNQLSSSDGLLVLQVFGPITVALSILGITAATLDLKPLLLLFSGLIFVEFVALMVVASPLVQVQSQMDGAVDEVFLNVTPLYKTDQYIQTELNKLQSSYVCCGLRHAEDWRDQLPASCFCTPNNSSSEDSCVMLDNEFYSPTTDKLWVHSEPCGPVLKSYLSFPIKLRIGIISAVATITMAAIALCLTLGLEEYWKKPPVEATVDDFNRVKYQPKPILT